MTRGRWYQPHGKGTGRCGNKKVRYGSKEDAMEAALSASMSYGHAMRTYKCQDGCGGWHITKRTWETLAEWEAQNGQDVETRNDGGTSASVASTEG